MNQSYPEKRKNRSPLAVIVNGWGCALAAIMLVIGLGFGLTLSLFLAPQLLGFHVTATALSEQAILLAATHVDLDLRENRLQASATLLARDVLATQAALGNQAEGLAGTARQLSLQIAASGTAAAAANARQQTQVALDFASTQAQFQANATSIELDYRNTQAALGITPAAEANVLPSATMTSTPTATASLTPIPTATHTPTRFVRTSSFDQGIAQGWTAPQPDAWETVESGTRALVDGVLLLSEQDFSGDFIFHVTFDPAQVASSEYDLLFGAGRSGGYTFHIDAQGVAASEVTFYQFAGDVLDASQLQADALTVIVGTRSSQLLRVPSTLRMEVEGRSVRVFLDDTLLLGTDLPLVPSGVIGIRLPAGAILRTIYVEG